jgi:hypothetical protein
MNYKDGTYELLKIAGEVVPNRGIGVTGQISRLLGCSNGRAKVSLEMLADEGLVELEYKGRNIVRATIARRPH